ncbi:MAG: ankyrin repeat domain-containing protein [Parachlamydiaceae bacterium]
MLIATLVGFFNMPLQAITQEELQEFAVKNNDSELIEILIKYSDSKDILHRAMNERDYFTVFILIEYGFDVNHRYFNHGNQSKEHSNKTIIEMAVEANEISLVEYFLQKKADPTLMCGYCEKKNNQYVLIESSAVYEAIMHERLDVLLLFYQYEVDLNKTCYWEHSIDGGVLTPLQIAIKYRKKDVANFLLSIGSEI